MISLEQINTKYVKAIPIPDEDTRPIKGYDICEEVYANIFLCAKKKSGKTSALFKIMKECVVKNTIIYIFCSTAYKDKNWIQIRQYFKNKGMDVHVFTSIFDDGQDQLLNLIEDLKQEAKDEEEAKEHKEEEIPAIDRCDDILGRLEQMYLRATGKIECLPDEEEEEEPKRKKRSKYLAPEYMIIFDDLSSELKSRSLLSLLKFNRHFKSKLIISSQWLHDLIPESRKQIDLFMIFRGFPEKKLNEIYKDADTGISFDLFYQMYKKATKRPHSFLYICTRSDSFRRNFDSKFIIHDKEI
ncbi:MAG TPA: hypothetical protein PLS50_05995 [Candidatus Dojkabacteria bacterium]|nr:hypothetical protein [Candidatus Dojkabacteria bacterium]